MLHRGAATCYGAAVLYRGAATCCGAAVLHRGAATCYGAAVLHRGAAVLYRDAATCCGAAMLYRGAATCCGAAMLHRGAATCCGAAVHPSAVSAVPGLVVSVLFSTSRPRSTLWRNHNESISPHPPSRGDMHTERRILGLLRVAEHSGQGIRKWSFLRGRLFSHRT